MNSLGFVRASFTRTRTRTSTTVKWPPCRRWYSSTIVQGKGGGSESVDTLIIGGGPIGSSTAYHLACERGNNGSGIVVIEKDPTYRSASATLSAGGIRQQFSLEENVRMSMYGRDFLREFSTLLATSTNPNPDPQFVEHGYLFLASTEQGVQQLRANHKVQNEIAGCTDIHLYTPSELEQMFPWLYTGDILLGSFGAKGEGWYDPWAVIHGLKAKNKELGVTYLHATPIGAQRNSDTGHIESVEVLSLDNKTGSSTSTMTTQHIPVNRVVNAAGAHASTVLKVLTGGDDDACDIPVRGRKRSIFFFHCSSNQQHEGEIVPHVAPLTVDPQTGVYFRTEGKPGAGNFLCGVSPPSDQDEDYITSSTPNLGQDILHADEFFWDDCIWPALYNRVPAFGSIKLQSSWAGLYDYNTFDQNGIIDFHPDLPNVLLVNGFSGHGLQHSPAAGRAAAELLEHGEFVSLDLSLFSFDRLLEGGTPVMEQGIV